MEEFVEIFIKNKCDEIPVGSAEYINKFLPFYANIPSDDLAFLFAYMHSSCNGLFEFMNDKLTVNHHFNADASRSMLSLIDLYRKLDKSLKNTKFDFELDNEYLETINLCKTFLRSSGGSTIPNDFKRIDIIEIRPIFQLLPG